MSMNTVVTSLAERQSALVAAFPIACDALGDYLQDEFDRYTYEYPDPVRPFRNEAQLFALYLLNRYALTDHGEPVADAVHEDLTTLRRRDSRQ
jgi:hypothetical protein